MIKNEPFFRAVDRKLCIINDMQQALPMLSHFAPDFMEVESVNSLLCEAYIDTEAGLTYEVLAATYYEDGDYSVLYSFDDAGIKIRACGVNKDCIIPIDNKALKKRYSLKLSIVDHYYSDEEVVNCRSVSELDQFRNEDYPDDVAAILYKPEMSVKPETIWVRCEKYIGKDKAIMLFKGKLLNEPFNDFGVHVNDPVTLISGVNDDGDRLLLIVPKSE